MTDREKLIDVLKQAPFEGKILDEWWWEEKIARIADHLLANGVRLESEQATSDENKRWIPVTERLPDKKGEYLVAYHPCYWDNVHDAFIVVGVDTFRGKTAWAKSKFQRVTHWMPLPEPPKEVSNEA